MECIATCVAMATGETSDRRSDRMPLNQRLRRYQARGLAWPENQFDEQLAALADLELFPDA